MRKMNPSFQRPTLKKFRIVNRAVILSSILLSLFLALYFFKPGLYLSDRYSWYLYIADKQQDVGRQDALDYIEKAIRLDGERAEGHEKKVEFYRGFGMPGKAEKELLSSNRLNGSSFFYSHLGYALLDQGRAKEALSIYNRGLEIYPPSERDLLGVGLAYLILNDTDEAIEHLEKSRSLITESTYLSPRERQRLSSRTHAGLGFAYQQKGDFERAREEFESASSIQKESIPYVSILLLT